MYSATGDVWVAVDARNIKAVRLYTRLRFRINQNVAFFLINLSCTADFETVLRFDPDCNEARVELGIFRKLWKSGEGDFGNGSSTDEFPYHNEEKPGFSSHWDFGYQGK